MRLEQSVLKERVTDAVVHDQSSTLQLLTILAFSQLVAPFLESTFRKFHDVALVHQRHGLEVVRQSIVDGAAYESLTALF